MWHRIGVIFVLLLPLLTFATIYAESSANSLIVIPIIPSMSILNVNSTTKSGSLWNPVLIDLGVIDVDVWGLSGHEDELRGYVDVAIDQRGVLRLLANLDLTNVPLKPWNVIAYPGVIYGVKPWSPDLKHPQHGVLQLPVKLRDLPRVYILLDYAVLNTTTRLNIALDAWILKTNQSRMPEVGDIELMVWFYREGPDEPPRPAGNIVKTVRISIVSDGFIEEALADVWIEEKMNDRWTYVAFVIRDIQPRRELLVSFTSIINELSSLLKVNPEEYYLHSIEIGFEIFYSPIIKMEAAIYKYYIIIGGERDLRINELVRLTPKSRRLIAWVTPWGYPFKAKEFNEYFTPGVVLAYDVECGLCTSTLRYWLNTSLSYIKEFIDRDYLVFVNLFGEKYHPFWRWRGELVKVVLNTEVLERLKSIVGDGEDIYIGFSEMTSCVNTNKCLEELILAYKELRKMFPAARLYYYGSRGEDLERLIELYERGNLDIIGIDVWDYQYTEDMLRIAPDIASKISSLLNRLPATRIIIGEVGLRLNDQEAYIEPWSKEARAREEGIHIEYYKQVLKHLRELGLKEGYLGIWAWNDETFAVMEDSTLQEVIANEYVLMDILDTTQGIQPLTVNGEAGDMQPRTLLLITLATAISILFIILAAVRYHMVAKRKDGKDQ